MLHKDFSNILLNIYLESISLTSSLIAVKYDFIIGLKIKPISMKQTK